MTAAVQTIAVGAPRTVPWQGREVTTSIFKESVPGPVMVRRHNLDGDRQSDLSVHGGEWQAVYAYAAEHYDWWRARLGRDVEPPAFGENLTLRGFDEAAVALGDVFRMGEAELEATGPRLPCYKLGLRLGDPGAVKTFAESRRWGIYFRVVREGRIAVGDPVVRLGVHPLGIPAYELARLWVFDPDDEAGLTSVLRHEGLAPSWREGIEKRLRRPR